MSYVSTTCGLILDRPDADAIVLDGGFGRLLDFPFRDHRATETNPALFSEHPEDEWVTDSGSAYYIESIPELFAMAPKGELNCAAMTFRGSDTGKGETEDGRWLKVNAGSLDYYSDLWRLTPTVAHPTVDYALFYDTRAYSATSGYMGSIVTHSSLPFPPEPNFTLRAFRWGPSANGVVPNGNHIEVHIIGNPGERGQWGLYLPGTTSGTDAWRYPRLAWRLFPEDDWTPVQEFRTSGTSKASAQGAPQEQVVTWETVDRHFIITIDGGRFVYYVPDKYYGHVEPLIPQGPIGVYVYNHKAAINVTEIEYPSGGYAERSPVAPAIIDFSIFNTGGIVTYDGTDSTKAYYRIAWTPQGTTCTVAANYDSSLDNGNWKYYFPQVWFRQAGDGGDGTGVTDTYHRAVAYLAQMDIEPSLSGGTHLAVTAPPTDIMMSAGGRITNTWKGATGRVELVMDRADGDTFIDDYKLKGNNKITLVPGIQQTAGADLGSTHHTGYLIKRSAVNRGATRTTITLQTRDGITRLEKRYWRRLGNFTGWYAGDMFRRVLNECEYPDSMIYVWNSTAGTPALQDYTTWKASGDASPQIALSDRRGELRFDFPDDKPVIDGLNDLLNSVGWFFGFDVSGNVFCRPTVTYDGSADLTLDEDAVAAAGVPLELEATPAFHATRAGRPFVNSVYVRIDHGGLVDEAWVRDVDSHQTGSAADFVGQEWEHVESLTEGQSALARAQQILEDRTGSPDSVKSSRELMITFTLLDQEALDLMPDQFVKVQSTGVGVTTDSIFQVTSKDWRVEGYPNLRYSAGFEARLVTGAS